MPAPKKLSSETRLSASKASTDVEPTPIDELLFDERNPRTPERLGPRPTQNQIRDLLIGEAEAREIVPSFMINGYLPHEPLLPSPQCGIHSTREKTRSPVQGATFGTQGVA